MDGGDAVVGSVAVGGVFLTAIVLFWQGFSTWRARIGAAREEEYKQVAEQAREASQQTAAALAQVAEELGALRAQVAEVERLMKEVD